MGTRAAKERRAVVAFRSAIDPLGDLRDASMPVRREVLEALRVVARSIDVSASTAPPEHYGRRVLMECSDWSLAAIALRFGQETEPHDHGGWGAVVTVRGLERDRRYFAEGGAMVLVTERDYRPGTGYLFNPVDIHQPVGWDPSGITVALHFLVNGDHTHHQAHREG